MKRPQVNSRSVFARLFYAAVQICTPGGWRLAVVIAWPTGRAYLGRALPSAAEI